MDRANNPSVSSQLSKANELERRLISFASRIMHVSSRLPRNEQGHHIAAQILRSGTATAANYGEARGAESRADFIHKLRIVLKELNETAVWLQTHCRKFFASLGNDRRDCRGKPRTLSNYRSLDSNRPNLRPMTPVCYEHRLIFQSQID